MRAISLGSLFLYSIMGSIKTLRPYRRWSKFLHIRLCDKLHSLNSHVEVFYCQDSSFWSANVIYHTFLLVDAYLTIWHPMKASTEVERVFWFNLGPPSHIFSSMYPSQSHPISFLTSNQQKPVLSAVRCLIWMILVVSGVCKLRFIFQTTALFGRDFTLEGEKYHPEVLSLPF